MGRTGYADLPLHGGKAPRWLFERMSSLARAMSLAIVAERGPQDLLNRISDPVWFQAFGCVLGFDWHSSGVTTTACGALKDGRQDHVSTSRDARTAMPRHHWVRPEDLDASRLDRILLKAYEAQPRDYTELLGVSGVGAKGLRALSLVAELTYGDPASVKDPVTFSFAHGGKDGTPFPVDRRTYDATIDSLHRALTEARLGRTEKVDAFKRLARLETAASSN